MTTRTARFRCRPTGTGGNVTGWNNMLDGATTGEKVGNALDSTGVTTGISASVTQAFNGSSTSGGLTSADHYGWPEAVWDNVWSVTQTVTGVIEFAGFEPGQPVTIYAAGFNPSAGRHINFRHPALTGDATQYVNSGGEGAVPAEPIEIAATANGGGVVSISATSANLTSNVNGFVFVWDDEWEPGGTGGEPTITGITGGNETSQYGAFTIEGTGFGATQGSVTLDGEPCDIISWSDTEIVARAPGDLADGTYDLVVETDDEQTATLNDVEHEHVYSIKAPEFPVDSNSIWNGQGWAPEDEVVYWGGPPLPLGWAFADPYTGWDDAPTDQDVNDYLLAPDGYTGSRTLTFDRIYSDGTVVAWSVTLNVQDGVISVVWSGIKFIDFIGFMG